MKKEKPRIKGTDAMKQLRAAKLEVSKQLYDELAAKFAKPASHKTQ